MSCPGELLEGRYELEAQLGQGGTAVVFRARDLVTKATVAIKVMDPGRERDPEALAYFRQEGRLAARIRDPHLVAALHFGVDEDRHFIVYDYLPGTMPLSVLAELGRVAPRRACEIALQVLYALDTLHRAGVVHGDVCLNNCLWRERDGGRDEVRLCDLGCAWARAAVSNGPTAASIFRGTAYFTAPEIMNEEAGDHRVDLWSVGAMMYTLMTAHDVDVGDPEEPDGIPPPALLVSKIPQAMSDVVMRALAPVDQRFPSAGAMIEALRGVLAAPPPRRGVPLWASIAGMGLAAGFATVASLAGMANADNSSAGRAGPVASAAIEPVSRPDRDQQTTPPVPPHANQTNESVAPRPETTESKPIAANIAPTRKSAPASETKPSSHPVLTWATVERAVTGKAAALRPCSGEDFISLGLRVANGRAILETLDGNPVTLPRDRCAHDVVSRLRFAKSSDEITGMAGIKLPDAP